MFNFVELWDRFVVLTCVPWFNALVLQVSGLYIEHNTMSVLCTDFTDKLDSWCITALSVQTGYIVPQEYEIYHAGPRDKTNL